MGCKTKEEFYKRFERLDTTKYSKTAIGGMITQINTTDEVWSWIQSHLAKAYERGVKDENDRCLKAFRPDSSPTQDMRATGWKPKTSKG